MALLDFILNLAGLLLWLNWRFLNLARNAPPAGGISLAGTLKSTASMRTPAWPYLVALLALLVVRTLAYYTIGSNLRINMVLSFGIVSFSFNPRQVLNMFLFSGLSFATFAAVFYSWLILFSVVNQQVTQPDACLRLVRLHLGRLQRLPVWARVCLPGGVAAISWLLVGRLLEAAGLFPVQSSFQVRGLRSLLLAAYSYLMWAPPLIGLLVLYQLTDYIYMGEAAFWNFVATTGRNVLNLGGAWRLRTTRIDFTPLLWLGLLGWLAWDGRSTSFTGAGAMLINAFNSLR